MAATVLADFVGTFDAETRDWDEPVEGRVLLNESQLVLAVDNEERATIPLTSVFDVNVGGQPRGMGPFPGTPVTVAFQAEGRRSVAVVAAEEDTAEKFATVLFKTILNDEPVTVKHPARVGGRVTDASFQPGRLALDAGGVAFETRGDDIYVELAAVTDFDREKRTVDGTEQPVLVISHMQDGTGHMTLAAMESTRRLSVLGRYLRRHYDRLMDSLEDVSLSESKVETLVTLYSTREMDVSLSSVVDEQPRRIKRLLKSLHGDGLVEPTPDGPALTTRGQVVVNHYMQKVNA